MLVSRNNQRRRIRDTKVRRRRVEPNVSYLGRSLPWPVWKSPDRSLSPAPSPRDYFFVSLSWLRHSTPLGGKPTGSAAWRRQDWANRNAYGVPHVRYGKLTRGEECRRHDGDAKERGSVTQTRMGTPRGEQQTARTRWKQTRGEECRRHDRDAKERGVITHT